MEQDFSRKNNLISISKEKIQTHFSNNEFGDYCDIDAKSQFSDDNKRPEFGYRFNSFEPRRSLKMEIKSNDKFFKWRVLDLKKQTPFRFSCFENFSSSNTKELLKFYSIENFDDNSDKNEYKAKIKDDISIVISQNAIDLLKEKNKESIQNELMQIKLPTEIKRRLKFCQKQASIAKLLVTKNERNCEEIARKIKLSKYCLKKLIVSNFNPVSLINSKTMKRLTDQKFQRSQVIFKQFFNKHKKTFQTIEQFRDGFLQENQELKPMSISKFKRNYFNPFKITKKIQKHVSRTNEIQFVISNRLMFLEAFRRMMLIKKQFVFFDESSFEVRHKNQKAYDFPGRTPSLETFLNPIIVKLTLICSFTKVLGFQLDSGSSTGQTIFQFLKEFGMRRREKSAEDAEKTVIVLDNSPKNKIEKIANFANKGYIQLLYIIPNSPFLNFVENIFLKLKKDVYSTPFSQRSVW